MLVLEWKQYVPWLIFDGISNKGGIKVSEMYSRQMAKYSSEATQVSLSR